MRQQQRFAKDDMKFIPFKGGLSTSGMAMTRKAGTLSAAMNYEPALDGGYRRTKGYERFSGLPSPSAARISLVSTAITAGIAAGAVVTIGAASGVFVGSPSPNTALLANVTGTIVAGTPITIGATVHGVVTSLSTGLEVSASLEAELVSLAQDVIRASIVTVPGTSSTRGVAILKNKVYAWRDNAGVGGMFASSATGWQPVTFGEEVAFTNANTNVKAGQVLTKGGVTANVKVVVVETGSLQSGVNTGRLILSGRAGGALSAGAATVAGGGTLTLGGASTQISLPAGGTYRHVVHNFSGAAGRDALYFVNGVGRAHSFDGTDLVPINTGDPLDTPAFVAVHAERLILGIGASLMWSAASAPLVFDGISGAAEFAMGADVTGFVSLPGKTLGVTTDKSIKMIAGTPSSTMEMPTLSADYGALAGAALATVDMFSLSSFGLLSLKATDRFGDFEANNASDDFATVARKMATVFSCAGRVDISESENQLRYMGSDGSGLVLLIQGGGVASATSIQYPISPTAMASGRIDGVDRVFIAATNGFVYELTGASPSFDGEEIEAYFRTNDISLGSPLVDKTFRDAFVEVASSRSSSVSVSCELSGGSPRLMPTDVSSFDAFGAGGVFDISDWDSFYWDAPEVSSPKVSIRGTGRSLSMLFYSKSRYDTGHTLQGVSIRSSARKTTRQS